MRQQSPSHLHRSWRMLAKSTRARPLQSIRTPTSPHQRPPSIPAGVCGLSARAVSSSIVSHDNSGATCLPRVARYAHRPSAVGTATLRCAMLRSHAEVMKKLVDTLVAGGTDFQLEQCARGVLHCRANNCITAAHCCLIDCLLLEIIRLCSTEPRDCHFRQPQCSSRSGHVELPRGGCLCVCWLHHR